MNFYEDYDWSDEDNCCAAGVLSSDEDEEQCWRTFGLEGPQKKSLLAISGIDKSGETQDDFEKEMAAELSATMKVLTTSLEKKAKEIPVNVKANAVGLVDDRKTDKTDRKVRFENSDRVEGEEFYDNIYFDSDDSDWEDVAEPATKGKGKANKKGKGSKTDRRRILTNDELFYDPSSDDKDQQWVDNQRRSYQVKRKGINKTTGLKSQGAAELPESDAVLNCPACLTTLCFDCQRHAVYGNQYRAMFVFNCRVDYTEKLSFPSQLEKRKAFLKGKKNKFQGKKQRLSGSSNHEESLLQGPSNNMEESEPVLPEMEDLPFPVTSIQEECSSATAESSAGETSSPTSLELSVNDPQKGGESSYNPVFCTVCNTKVAVYDVDEVYHFFNVVTSY